VIDKVHKLKVLGYLMAQNLQRVERVSPLLECKTYLNIGVTPRASVGKTFGLPALGGC